MLKWEGGIYSRELLQWDFAVRKRDRFNKDKWRFIAKKLGGGQWMENYWEERRPEGFLLDLLKKFLIEGRPEEEDSQDGRWGIWSDIKIGVGEL